MLLLSNYDMNEYSAYPSGFTQCLRKLTANITFFFFMQTPEMNGKRMISTVI